MPSLYDIPPWLIRTFAVAFGLIWGSFLNVVIHRVPRGESVVRPASKCPNCGQPIRPWNNIPVLSWVLLRGRARCCGARISPRYVLVEAASGLMALAIVEVLLLPMPPDTTLLRVAVVFVSALALVLALMAAAFIDLEHMYIPDPIPYGLTVIGLATHSLRDVGWRDAVVAAAGSFLLVWLVFGVLYRWVRGRTGMGMGDAKLLMVAGAWFGWKGAAFALMAGAVQATVAAAIALVVRGKIDEPEAVTREREEILAQVAAIEDPAERARAERELETDPIFETSPDGNALLRIPFGPFLALAMIEYLLVGDALAQRYLGWLAY